MSDSEQSHGLMVAKVAIVLIAGFGLGAGIPMLLLRGGVQEPAAADPAAASPAQTDPAATDPAPADAPVADVPAVARPDVPAANPSGDGGEKPPVQEPATDPVQGDEPGSSQQRVRVETLTEQAVDAWLDEDDEAAMRCARAALLAVDETGDPERTAVLRERLGKLVARVREARERKAREREAAESRAALAAPVITGAQGGPPATGGAQTPDEPEPDTAPPRTTSRLTGAVALSLNEGADLVRLSGIGVSLLQSRLGAGVAAVIHEDVVAVINAEHDALSRAVEAATGTGTAPASAVRTLKRLRAQITQLATDRDSVDGLFSALTTARASVAERTALAPGAGEDTAAPSRKIDTLLGTVVVQARIFEVTTDDVGSYAFPELAPGKFLVHATSVTKRWHVEWLTVFDAATPADYRFDLSNENARWLRVAE